MNIGGTARWITMPRGFRAGRKRLAFLGLILSADGEMVPEDTVQLIFRVYEVPADLGGIPVSRYLMQRYPPLCTPSGR